MLIVDKYYQIIERDSYLVSYCWKVYHIFCLLGAVITSFLVVYYFQAILHAFGNNCVIDSRLIFNNDSHYNYIGNFSRNNSFHNHKTIWGPKFSCDSCLFVFIFFCLMGMILTAFFIIVPKGGAVEEHEIYVKPWRIVIPSILISISAALFTFIYYFKLTTGIEDFCEQFSDEGHRCDEEINEYSLIFHEQEINIYKYIKIVNQASYMVFVFWILLLITLVLRILRGADFKIIVYNLDKKKKQFVDGDTDSESLSELIVESTQKISLSSPVLVIHASDYNIQKQKETPAVNV